MAAAILAQAVARTPQTAVAEHRENAMRHALKRLRQRYGRHYGEADLLAHMEAIRAGQARVVSIGEASTIYKVQASDRVFIVAWSRHLGCVSTYLLASDPRYAGGRKVRVR